MDIQDKGVAPLAPPRDTTADAYVPLRPVNVCGRTLNPGPVFDTYWRFAAERQAIYEARLQGTPAPWTSDPILLNYRFTNCYRATDRVSQFLISRVAYGGPQDVRNLIFRVLLFKLFNCIRTWEILEAEIGEISWQSFNVDRYDAVLHRALASKSTIYSSAYVIPPPSLGARRKHTNHLRLLSMMFDDHVDDRVVEAGSMLEAFRVLRRYPSIGDFIGYQLLIDINYTCALNFCENEYIVAGPGARDGIRKCFGPAADGLESDIIAYMTDTQEAHFSDRQLTFNGLRGRQLHLIDCQNLFCEVDKYARMAHPGILGISGRTRIKRQFRPAAAPVTDWFPPKWGLN